MVIYKLITFYVTSFYSSIIYKMDNSWKKKISKLIRKIKDSGDKDKLIYVKNLYRYYNIFYNLNYLVRSNPILNEDKYCSELFYNYLLEDVIDTSQRVIYAIISCVSNDEPLDSFHKFLMFPEIYEKDYQKEENDKQKKIDNKKEMLKILINYYNY